METETLILFFKYIIKCIVFVDQREKSETFFKFSLNESEFVQIHET